MHRRAANEERARAGAAEARAPVSVPKRDADALDRYAEDIDRKLRERGRQTLPHCLRGRENVDDVLTGLVGGNRDGHVFGEHIGTGPFDERRHAASAQLALALRRCGTCREAVPVGVLHALVHHRRKIAGVVSLGHRVRVRQLRGPDHVATAQLDGVNTGLPRGGVHQALDGVDGFGTTRAAIRAGGRGVGEHTGDTHVDRVNVVQAGGDPRPDEQLDHDAGRRRVGAQISVRMHAQRQDAAIGIECQRRLADQIAAMGGTQKFFHAFSGPFHRATQQARAIRSERILRVECGLHAEATADITDQHAHFFGRNAQHLVAQFVAQARGRLATHAQRESIRSRVKLRQRTTGLDRTCHQSLIDDVERDHMRGPRKRGGGGIGTAMTRCARDVAGGRGPYQCSTGRDGGRNTHNRRQRLIPHVDRFCRIACLFAGLGHDRDHGLADEARRVHGQHALRRRSGSRPIGPLEIRRHQQRLHACSHQICPGHDRKNAGHLSRGRDIRRRKPGMGVRRAQKHEIRLTGQRKIVGEEIAAGQEGVILDAAHGFAAAEARGGRDVGHGVS